MIQILLLGGALALALLVVVAPTIGFTRVLIAVLLGSLLLIPYPLVLADVPDHFGITNSTPIPYTYTLVLFCLALVLMREKGVLFWLSYAALATAFLSLCAIGVWGNDAAIWAGIVHYGTGLVAFGVGVGIAVTLKSDPGVAVVWVWVAAAIFLLEILLMAMQLVGVPVSVYGSVATYIAESRPFGSFMHPGIAGKTVLLMMPALFPFTVNDHRNVRVGAWMALALGVGATALTQGRANTIAVVGAILIWLVLTSRGTWRRKAVIVGVALAACVPVALVLLPRFLSDPEGGDRAELLSVGIATILDHPLWGVGPNAYSSIVGQWNSLAANGYPVHVTFLHLVAELGILAAIVVIAPLAGMIVVAARRIFGTGLARTAALAVISCAPGMLLVLATSWGLLLQGALPLWMCVAGVSLGLMTERQSEPKWRDSRGRATRSTPEDPWISARMETVL